MFASPRTRRFASARKTHDDSTFNDRKRTSTHSNNLTDAMFRLTAPPLTWYIGPRFIERTFERLLMKFELHKVYPQYNDREFARGRSYLYRWQSINWNIYLNEQSKYLNGTRDESHVYHCFLSSFFFLFLIVIDINKLSVWNNFRKENLVQLSIVHEIILFMFKIIWDVKMAAKSVSRVRQIHWLRRPR